MSTYLCSLLIYCRIVKSSSATMQSLNIIGFINLIILTVISFGLLLSIASAWVKFIEELLIIIYYHNHTTMEHLQRHAGVYNQRSTILHQKWWFIGLWKQDPNLKKRRSFSLHFDSNWKDYVFKIMMSCINQWYICNWDDHIMVEVT